MSKKYCDLIYKLIVAVSLEYLLFFGLEAILPGMIVNIFNINILLVLVIILLGMLLGLFPVVSAENCQGILMKSGQSKLFKGLIIMVSVFLVLVIIIVWHKLTLLLIITYLFTSFLAGYLLWRNT